MIDGAGGHGASRPTRHDLLIVEPGSWSEVLATRRSHPALSAPQSELVGRWADAGWPVIARRTAPGEDPTATSVGLPLPPVLGKARLALSIPPGATWRKRDGVDLSDVRSVAPEAWAETIAALELLASALGLRPKVFGALLWQSLTGLNYLHSASDLDLLWFSDDGEKLIPLLEGLARIDVQGAVRIDGEVLMANVAVNWRELHEGVGGGVDFVLGKTLDEVRLVQVGGLLARGRDACS